MRTWAVSPAAGDTVYMHLYAHVLHLYVNRELCTHAHTCKCTCIRTQVRTASLGEDDSRQPEQLHPVPVAKQAAGTALARSQVQDCVLDCASKQARRARSRVDNL